MSKSPVKASILPSSLLLFSRRLIILALPPPDSSPYATRNHVSFFPAMMNIVGTLGPKSRLVEAISGCLKAGMSGNCILLLSVCLKAGLRRYGSTMKDTEIRDLMDTADVDNNGTIDYGEFIGATIHLNKLQRDDHLVAAFRSFDKDGSGYITVDELQQACVEHNMTDPYCPWPCNFH